MLTLPGYSIEEKLYESGRSLIHRGRRQNDNGSVILKTLNEPYPTPERIARFKREYEVLRDLQLDGVTRAYNLERHQQQYTIILEDFGGVSLDNLLENGRNPFQPHPNQPKAIPNFLKIAIQISDILGQIYQYHIIHKDITPANILVNPANNQVKLTDFGIATTLSRENPVFRNPNVLEGTLAYMSPEQTGRMNQGVDYRTDFYSLGVTFYELLSGQRPFPGRDPLELVHAHIARQPVPLCELNPAVPVPISQIVMKLLAKNPEERYQSAQGLKTDWAHCLQQWQENGQIHPFPLGQHDFSDRFQLPQRLYGREAETAVLLETFAQVSQGQNQLLLVTGQAGIGKTALVQELYRPITEQRGYFIAGKFDQFQRHIPYASLLQALRSLIQLLLTETETQIQQWHDKIRGAVGTNGRLITDVIQEVELIIGEQPEVTPLPPAETENRFNRVFQNFIRVFAQAEHPLVIFLDDLQWADSASLKLIRLLVTAPDSQYLLLIGAYRDNEVDATHALAMLLKELQPTPTTLSLAALSDFYVGQFVADALRCDPAQAHPLADLVHGKTGGNPFFIGEFLKSLHDDELLWFNHQQGQWQWEVERIQTLAITDNVVTLMADKVQKLPPETQEALKLAACIGNQFELEILAVAADWSRQGAAVRLWPAISEGLLYPLSDTYKLVALASSEESESLNALYKFAHDRIQQAVYSLIPEADKEKIHLQIGRLLLQHIPDNKQEQHIFDLVYQLNEGKRHITAEERPKLAHLNLQAGQKAKASTAYRPALNYLQTGLTLLKPDSWQIEYELALNLHAEAAETAYLAGEFEEMERLVQVALANGRSPLDKVHAYDVQIQAYRSQTRLRDAVQVGVVALRSLGVNLPNNPTRFHAVRDLVKTRLLLIRHSPEQLLNQPEMTDPVKLAALRILMSISSAAFIGWPDYYPLVILYMVRTSIRYGMSHLSAFAYATYGLILTGFLEDIKGGHQFSKLALALLERFHNKETAAKVLFVLNFMQHWLQPVEESIPSLSEAYQAALENGDLEFAGYALYTRGVHLYTIDTNLQTVERELASYSRAMRQMNQGNMYRLNEMHRQVTLNLLGESADPLRLVGEAYNETEMFAALAATNDATALASIHYRRLLLAYTFQDYAYALESANGMANYLNSVRGSVGIPQYYIFDCLTRLACITADTPAETQQALLKEVAKKRKKLKQWAELAPSNYLAQYHTVEAEWARVMGQEAAAREHYDKAVALAQQEEHPHKQAVASELAAQFYQARGQTGLARYYLQDAYYAYRQWGAMGKVKLLEAKYPELLTITAVSPTLTSTFTTSSSSTIQRAANILDLTSVVKASQTLSGEIVPERLLTHLMEIVLENAGAQRGCLILEQDGQWQVAAEGSIDQEVVTALPATPVVYYPLPLSVMNYVARTKENVVLNDATQGTFAHDPYVQEKRPKSILCAPLLNQGKLTGILYLENNLATAAFTPDRLEVLTLLSSQAAISIENAFLYANLEKRVAERTAELSEANAFLTESNAELDAFAHTVAHDLKNPLGVAIGYAELLQEIYEDSDDAELKKYLAAIARGGYKMRDIVNALLVLSKIHKEQAVEAAALDMEHIVKEVTQRLDFMVVQYGATVIVPESWPTAVGYAAWVEEVWVNYFTNALKYGGNPPVVELGTAVQDDGMVRFWVRDNGEGLTPEQQAQLFTPFTRVTQAKVEGHGLGLSIVQRIVQRLGGRVGVESELGKGSVFYFTLPTQS